MADNVWPRVAVMGAGAVGCYFGGMLARAGAPVTLIGRATHVDAIRTGGLFIDSISFAEQVAVSAATDVSAADDAEIVLFSVKTLNTAEAAQALAPHLGPGAMIVSLQNGVDNAEQIRAATGIDAIPAIVYVAASMSAPGRVKHVGRGDLIVGADARSAEIARLFERAGVRCRVSANIAGDLWTKLIMNCAYNAISALSRANYGRIAGKPETRELIRQIVEEAQAVAKAAGVRLADGNITEAAWRLGSEMMQNAVSSTAQDIERGNRTEIDSLNGYLVRRGQEFGVPAPVNQTLYALVKLLEDRRVGTAVG